MFTSENTSGANNVKYRHGMWGSRLHKIWLRMNQRCHNPKCGDFKFYGAKGVSVCDHWRQAFLAFREDVGEPEPGMTLDRFPNRNGNYEPGNVRWATRKEQADNSSVPRIIEANGRRMNQSEWARFHGVNPSAVASRISKGMDPVAAVTMPFRRKPCHV